MDISYLLNIRIILPIVIFSIIILFAYPLDSESQTDDLVIPGDLIPKDNTPGPVADVDVSYKFDNGFYDKIQGLILETPQDGDFGVYDGTRYYNVIIIVTRDDGDGRDPEETARENKDAIVKRLELLGARDIIPAESLSFVTASIPVADIPGFSLHDEIYALGDGELAITLEVDTARETIRATPGDIRGAVGKNLDGSGIVVGVIDSGINHDFAFGNRIIDRILCWNDGCTAVTANNVTGLRNNTIHQDFTSHGTRVAQVLAASGLPQHNGIAPGVDLLDVAVDRESELPIHQNPFSGNMSSITHGLDHSLRNGADVVNMSLGINSCSSANTMNLVINEAVDKGMVAVSSAGNDGDNFGRPIYKSITYPGCAYNEITVGGINDRIPGTITMADLSSRGPARGTVILKPEIVAPAFDIQTLSFVANATTEPRSGTSYAAPQVSATAAMMLQIEPELTPAEIKAGLLLGANWTGPVPCTSTQYERYNPNDNCSYARQPSNYNTANNAASLEILNNVGFGILNTAESLRYAHISSSYIVSDHFRSDEEFRKYRFTVTDTSEPAKVILVWLVHPHGSIIDQTNRTINVPISNLDFTITDPLGNTIRAESDFQTNEFAVFDPPSTGTYTVTVTGSNITSINKPVQNFALASTNPLVPIPSFRNSEPIALPNTIVVSPGMEKIVLMSATDQDGNAVSFHISRDPSKGIITTNEFITKTTSRAIYIPDAGFSGTDTFEITPHDGMVSGTPATITVIAESLPPGSGMSELDSSNVLDWDIFHVTSGFMHEDYSKTFYGKNYAVSALYLGSVNMEGVDLRLVTTNGNTYDIAIPPSGTRIINFTTPINIESATLSADGIDEEAAYNLNSNPLISDPISYAILDFLFNLDDVRMFVGYVPSTTCAPSGASGASSCPIPVYRSNAQSSLAIPDNTRMQDTSSIIAIPTEGTLFDISVSVDITHTYIGDLIITLTSPQGTEITLHNREGGSTDNIIKTFDSLSNTNLQSLIDSSISGNWTLSIGDYFRGDVGTLNEWELDLTYNPSQTQNPNPSPTPTQTTTIFSDDFESSLNTKWIESGEGDWRTSTSQLHAIPVVPNHDSSNTVLHSDYCNTSCTITLKDSLDLSYSSASLSFWRFVDSALDNDEYLKVELYDGNRWNTIYHWSDNLGGDDHRWHMESYDLTSYLGTSDFKIRFVTQQNSPREDVQIDDVMINATTATSMPSPQPPTPTLPTAISEDFDNLDNWTQSGDSDWRIRSPSPTVPDSESGNTVAYASNCDRICTITLSPVDLSALQSGYLTFDRFVGAGLDYGEYLQIELYDGTTWNTIFDWQASAREDDNTWHTESYNLAPQYLVSDMQMRITARSSSGSEITMIDSVSIQDSASSPNPTLTNYSIYIADTDDRQVQVYSQDGSYLGDIVTSRSGGLGKVWDVAFGPDGHLYVSDNTYGKIRKYDGSTGIPISSNSGWATTQGYPNALTWKDNTLYVATQMGVERFSLSGSALGYFGDASRNPGAGATRLFSAYDVVFCPDGYMYVADRAAGKILYYTASSGAFVGEIYGLTSTLNTRAAAGLECGPAIYGSGTSLFQSGDDNGRVNEINLSNNSLVRSITSFIDEPYGMEMDHTGILYVVNKDDENVIRILPGGTTSVIASDFDDPRGITLGPEYNAAGPTADSAEPSNDAPEFDLIHNGTILYSPIHAKSHMTLDIQAIDSEGDHITIELIPDTVPEDAISLSTGDNTELIINTQNIPAGTYVFWIIAYDESNYEREPYALIIE